MVSASILAVGMVMVARGLLTASSTLQTVDNRISAYLFLQGKLAELQQDTLELGGLAAGEESGTLELNERPATWTVVIAPVLIGAPRAPEEEADPERQGSISGIEEPEPGFERPAAGGLKEPDTTIAQVTLTAAWQEARRQQDVVLMTFLGYKAPPGEPQEGVENPS